MADISREIQAFRNAIYGEEVRGSMISLAEKVNKESTDAKTASAQSAESAAASIQLANIAVGRADTAAENADAAAQNIQDRADRGDFTSTVQIGSVTTGAAGTEASVSNSGTDKDVVLNLTIPRGDKGVSMYMAGAWNSGTEYVNSVSRIDIVTCNGSTYGCRQSHTSSQDNAPAGEENEYWICLARKGDTGNIENIDTIPIAFSEAAEPENLESGDSVTTVFGKIKKWFSDLSNGAASTLLGTNLQEGKVLVSDGAGKISASGITSDTLEYLDGLTGNVQERLDDKIDESKIIESTNITEKGFLMDGKTASDKFTEIGGTINRYNNYIPLTGNAEVLSDVLQVDDANKGSVLHKKYSITQSSSYGYLANMPDIISNTTSMIFRDVFYRSTGNILIRLLELYPVAGRVWYNGMTKSSSSGLTSWSGWHCSQPKDILLLNTTKYGVNFRIWGNPNEIHYRTSGSTTEEIPAMGTNVTIGTLPVGYRPKVSQIDYFIAGVYKCQIGFKTDGKVDLGYPALLTTGSGANIPSGIGVYTFGSVSLQSGE